LRNFEQVFDKLTVIVRELFREAILSELFRYPLRQYFLALFLLPSDQILDEIVPINSAVEYSICFIRFLVGKEVSISEFVWSIHNSKVVI
jgi:hypothetical protein